MAKADFWDVGAANKEIDALRERAEAAEQELVELHAAHRHDHTKSYVKMVERAKAAEADLAFEYNRHSEVEEWLLCELEDEEDARYSLEEQVTKLQAVFEAARAVRIYEQAHVCGHCSCDYAAADEVPCRCEEISMGKSMLVQTLWEELDAMEGGE